MSMNWHEAARGASPEQRVQFAPGIAKAQRYLDRLAAKGEIPERFVSDKPKLHPFLEGKVGLETLIIGGRTGGELLSAMTQSGVQVGSCARSMIENPAFTTLPEATDLDLVVVQAGILVPRKRGDPTIQEIFEAADKMKLDKVPAEVGPHYRLSHMDQPQGGYRVMGMKSRTDSYGRPRLFVVEHGDDGLLLDSSLPLGLSTLWWDPGSEFVFSLRK